MRTVKRNWWEIDADGKVLGRLASRIAIILMGKHKPDYLPYLDIGDFIVVINAEKIKVTGSKLENKFYYRHSGYPGGLKSTTLKELLKKHPERVIMYAVKNMLPKNKLKKRRLKRLKIYAGSAHPHQAQKPQKVEV